MQTNIRQNTYNNQYPFTVIDKKALRKLVKELPYGAPAKIRERLIKKFPDTPFSIDYIRKVLDPDDQRKNRIIIEEAVLFRDEEAEKNKALEARIFQS